MNILSTFYKSDRKSQKKIIKSLYKIARNNNDTDYKELQKMLNYYDIMEDFDKFRLKIEDLNKEELNGLLLQTYRYAREINKNGISLMPSEVFESKVNQCYFMSIDEEIDGIISQTINHLYDKNKSNSTEKMDINEFNNFTNKLEFEESSYLAGWLIFDFIDMFHKYILCIPNTDEIIDIVAEFDEYIRNHGDFYTLEVYNRLSVEEVIYLVGKLLTLSKDQLKEEYERSLHIKQQREKRYERKRSKSKTRLPKLREIKKQYR